MGKAHFLTLQDRIQEVLALKRIMDKWRGEKPPTIHCPISPGDEQDVLDLKEALVQFYTQSSINYFHRDPIIPRRLRTNA
jgi:hypothetical protein